MSGSRPSSAISLACHCSSSLLRYHMKSANSFLGCSVRFTPPDQSEPPYQTSLLRAVLGLVVGAVVGAAMIMTSALIDRYNLYGTLHPKFNFEALNLSEADYKTLSETYHGGDLHIFTTAFALWVIGLLAFGILPWWLLHRRNIRSWQAALVLGFFLTFSLSLSVGLYPLSSGFSAWDSGGATVENGKRTPHGWRVLFSDSVTFGALGGLVGIVIWRTAYRRTNLESHDGTPVQRA